MNAIYTSIETVYSQFKKISDLYIYNIKGASGISARHLKGYRAEASSALKYLANASITGIKQSLFGTDMDLNFVMLSARVYLALFVALAISFSQYVIKNFLVKKESHSFSNQDSMSASLCCHC